MARCIADGLFEYPIDLHYSQTRYHVLNGLDLFEYPIDLHYSQTPTGTVIKDGWFEYPIDLHYSQTGFGMQMHDEKRIGLLHKHSAEMLKI